MWLFALFIAVPLIEIALFIQVGGLIGLWPTLLIVVITAIVGTMLVRSQGILALERLRASMGELRDPSEPLAHGAMILFSGALLLTPGFFTDAVGFALLVPWVRQRAYSYARSKVRVQQFEYGETVRPPGGVDPSSDILEGDYHEVKPDPKKPSGWTRH